MKKNSGNFLKAPRAKPYKQCYVYANEKQNIENCYRKYDIQDRKYKR